MKMFIIVCGLLAQLVAVSTTVMAATVDSQDPAGSDQTEKREQKGGSLRSLEVNQAELKENPDLGQPPHPGLVDEHRRAPNPLMDLIDEVTAASDRKLAELKTRLSGEPDHTATLEIIRSIEQIKIQTELDILAVQANYARQTGREELALKIEAAITLMTTERPVRQPVDRPALPAGRP